MLSSTSTCGQHVFSDAEPSSQSVEDGEALAPCVPDVLISLASLPTATSAANIFPCGTSAYVTALLDYLQPGVDVRDAMYKLNQQLRQFLPHARTEVLSTINRPLVFPCRK